MDMYLSKLQKMVKKMMEKGSLVCCSTWGRGESDTTERLNNNQLMGNAVLLGESGSIQSC